MSNEEKLYELMGELLYAVAKADGIIQAEEKEALVDLLKDHQWAKEIKWSFEYEEKKGRSVEEAYAKVIDYCKYHGQSSLYPEFIESMKVIASSAEGVAESESEIMNSFAKDLLEKFQNDLDKIR